MSTYTPLDLTTEVLPNFPGLKPKDGLPFIFADNAGGSQILQTSVNAISSYLVHTNVQMGGGYNLSVQAASLLSEAKKSTSTLVNCPVGSSGKAEDGVVFGSSTTQVATNLAYACELAGMEGSLFEKGDEIILTTADHEDLTIKYWSPTPLSDSPFSLGLQLSTLAPLLSDKTRLVAFTATSNILGHSTDVQGAIKLIKEKTGGKAMTVVDCVAAAVHTRIDMVRWECDAVIFSCYKLFGPHLSVGIISPHSPLSTTNIPSLGHYFHPTNPISYKLAPGGAPYELQVGCTPILSYLLELGKSGNDDAARLDIAFARISAHEQTLSERLLGYLTSGEAREKGVRVVGPESGDHRAPTISFVVVQEAGGGLWKKKMSSKDIVAVFDQKTNIGLKYGHFYATRITNCIPLVQDEPVTGGILTRGTAWRPKTDEDGFVRISLVHYNTVEEVDQIIKVLKSIV